MKIIKNSSNVVLYAGDILTLTSQGAGNGDWIDRGTTTNNATIADVFDLPSDWSGGNYTYINGVWARTPQGEAAHVTEQQKLSGEVQAESSRRIQALLDNTAQAHGYDNILSLCSYATSKNLTWQKEGQYGVDFRDACWSKAQTIQDAVKAGTRPLPTVEEVLAEMPKVVWPV